MRFKLSLLAAVILSCVAATAASARPADTVWNGDGGGQGCWILDADGYAYWQNPCR